MEILVWSSRLRVGVFFEIVAGYFVLSQETFIALQFFCSLLCGMVLNEKEADKFCSAKIKMPDYFFQNFFHHRPTAS